MECFQLQEGMEILDANVQKGWAQILNTDDHSSFVY